MELPQQPDSRTLLTQDTVTIDCNLTRNIVLYTYAEKMECTSSLYVHGIGWGEVVK